MNRIVLAIAFWLLPSLLSAQHAFVPRLAPPNNIPITPARIALGEQLFHDKALSANGTVSCATCHDPAHGFSDANPIAVGIFGRRGTRRSPTLINTSYHQKMFWDGREIEQPTQSLQPIVNRLEMGDQQENQVLNRLRPRYEQAFRAAGYRISNGVAFRRETYGHAIASFESTLTSFDAPVDRRLQGDLTALSPDAERGFRVFVAAKCMECHTPPLFTNLQFINNGFEYAGKTNPNDRGRFDIQRRGNDSDEEFRRKTLRAFKVSTLRQLADRPPYGHHGAFPTIESVVGHYLRGGVAPRNGLVDRYQDPRIAVVGAFLRTRTADDIRCLTVFLHEGFQGYDAPVPSPSPALP